MERDFLGLSDKKYMSNVKHEAEDDYGVGKLGLNKKAATQFGKAKFLPNSNLMPANDFQESNGSLYQRGSVSAANVLGRGQFSGAFQNANPLLLGGSIPLTNHSSLHRVASSPTQLTIFYAGTITVFNDIYPDKAQAIMLCAAKGEIGQRCLKKPLKPAENVAVSSSSATHRDKPATNAMSIIESFNVGPRNMIPSVPQARKASLARFLEKRKERLMSAMPYKKMVKLDLSTGEESCGMNYSSSSY